MKITFKASFITERLLQSIGEGESTNFFCTDLGKGTSCLSHWATEYHNYQKRDRKRLISKSLDRKDLVGLIVPISIKRTMSETIFLHFPILLSPGPYKNRSGMVSSPACSLEHGDVSVMKLMNRHAFLKLCK